MNLRLISAGLILLTPAILFAAGGGHGEHGAEAIPVQSIFWQAVNLGILLTALIIFLKKSMVQAFADRQTSFIKQAEKTKAAVKEAEQALADTKERLADLEAGELRSIEKAKHDAKILTARIIADSEAASAKLLKEAEMSVEAELAKTKEELNAIILGRATEIVTRGLADIDAGAVSKQETTFVQQMGQVRP